MALLIYSTKKEGAGERLQRVIELMFPHNVFEIYRSIGELSKRLRQPVLNLTIAILLASSREELLDLLSLRELLWDMKIILILPDSTPRTIAEGHLLRPRFFSDCSSDFVDVAAVLNLMISNPGTDKNIDIHT